MSNKGFLMVRMPESLKSKLVEDASNVGVSLSPESRSRLKEMSDLSGRSCSAVINQLIKDFAGIEVLNENR